MAEAIEVVRAEWARDRRPRASRRRSWTPPRPTSPAPIRCASTATARSPASSSAMQMDGMPLDYIETRNDKVKAVTLEEVQPRRRSALRPRRPAFRGGGPARGRRAVELTPPCRIAPGHATASGMASRGPQHKPDASGHPAARRGRDQPHRGRRGGGAPGLGRQGTGRERARRRRHPDRGRLCRRRQDADPRDRRRPRHDGRGPAAGAGPPRDLEDRRQRPARTSTASASGARRCPRSARSAGCSITSRAAGAEARRDRGRRRGGSARCAPPPCRAARWSNCATSSTPRPRG